MPYYDGLMAGQHDALVESFADGPVVHDPIRGRVKGVRAFESFVTERSAWLAQRNVSVDDVDHMITSPRGFEEVVLHLDGEIARVDVPVAIVAVHRSDDCSRNCGSITANWLIESAKPLKKRPQPLRVFRVSRWSARLQSDRHARGRSCPPRMLRRADRRQARESSPHKCAASLGRSTPVSGKGTGPPTRHARASRPPTVPQHRDTAAQPPALRHSEALARGNRVTHTPAFPHCVTALGALARARSAQGRSAAVAEAASASSPLQATMWLCDAVFPWCGRRGLG